MHADNPPFDIPSLAIGQWHGLQLARMSSSKKPTKPTKS
jgi:hypothetical protein